MKVRYNVFVYMGFTSHVTHDVTARKADTFDSYENRVALYIINRGQNWFAIRNKCYMGETDDSVGTNSDLLCSEVNNTLDTQRSYYG